MALQIQGWNGPKVDFNKLFEFYAGEGNASSSDINIAESLVKAHSDRRKRALDFIRSHTVLKSDSQDTVPPSILTQFYNDHFNPIKTSCLFLAYFLQNVWEELPSVSNQKNQQTQNLNTAAAKGVEAIELYADLLDDLFKILEKCSNRVDWAQQNEEPLHLKWLRTQQLELRGQASGLSEASGGTNVSAMKLVLEKTAQLFFDNEIAKLEKSNMGGTFPQNNIDAEHPLTHGPHTTFDILSEMMKPLELVDQGSPSNDASKSNKNSKGGQKKKAAEDSPDGGSMPPQKKQKLSSSKAGTWYGPKKEKLYINERFEQFATHLEDYIRTNGIQIGTEEYASTVDGLFDGVLRTINFHDRKARIFRNDMPSFNDEEKRIAYHPTFLDLSADGRKRTRGQGPKPGFNWFRSELGSKFKGNEPIGMAKKMLMLHGGADPDSDQANKNKTMKNKINSIAWSDPATLLNQLKQDSELQTDPEFDVSESKPASPIMCLGVDMGASTRSKIADRLEEVIGSRAEIYQKCEDEENFGKLRDTDAELADSIEAIREDVDDWAKSIVNDFKHFGANTNVRFSCKPEAFHSRLAQVFEMRLLQIVRLLICKKLFDAGQYKMLDLLETEKQMREVWRFHELIWAGFDQARAPSLTSVKSKSILEARRAARQSLRREWQGSIGYIQQCIDTLGEDPKTFLKLQAIMKPTPDAKETGGQNTVTNEIDEVLPDYEPDASDTGAIPKTQDSTAAQQAASKAQQKQKELEAKEAQLKAKELEIASKQAAQTGPQLTAQQKEPVATLEKERKEVELKEKQLKKQENKLKILQKTLKQQAVAAGGSATAQEIFAKQQQEHELKQAQLEKQEAKIKEQVHELKLQRKLHEEALKAPQALKGGGPETAGSLGNTAKKPKKLSEKQLKAAADAQMKHYLEHGKFNADLDPSRDPPNDGSDTSPSDIEILPSDDVATQNAKLKKKLVKYEGMDGGERLKKAQSKLMLEWLRSVRDNVDKKLKFLAEKNRNLDTEDPGNYQLILTNNISIMAKSQQLWQIDAQIKALRDGLNPLTKPVVDAGSTETWAPQPEDYYLKETVKIPKKKVTPEGITSLAPGPMPGEHPQPFNSKVVVGAPPDFGRKPLIAESGPAYNVFKGIMTGDMSALKNQVPKGQPPVAIQPSGQTQPATAGPKPAASKAPLPDGVQALLDQLAANQSGLPDPNKKPKTQPKPAPSMAPPVPPTPKTQQKPASGTVPPVAPTPKPQQKPAPGTVPPGAPTPKPQQKPKQKKHDPKIASAPFLTVDEHISWRQLLDKYESFQITLPLAWQLDDVASRALWFQLVVGELAKDVEAPKPKVTQAKLKELNEEYKGAWIKIMKQLKQFLAKMMIEVYEEKTMEALTGFLNEYLKKNPGLVKTLPDSFKETAPAGPSGPKQTYPLKPPKQVLELPPLPSPPITSPPFLLPPKTKTTISGPSCPLPQKPEPSSHTPFPQKPKPAHKSHLKPKPPSSEMSLVSPMPEFLLQPKPDSGNLGTAAKPPMKLPWDQNEDADNMDLTFDEPPSGLEDEHDQLGTGKPPPVGGLGKYAPVEAGGYKTAPSSNVLTYEALLKHESDKYYGALANGAGVDALEADYVFVNNIQRTLFRTLYGAGHIPYPKWILSDPDAFAKDPAWPNPDLRLPDKFATYVGDRHVKFFAVNEPYHLAHGQALRWQFLTDLVEDLNLFIRSVKPELASDPLVPVPPPLNPLPNYRRSGTQPDCTLSELRAVKGYRLWRKDFPREVRRDAARLDRYWVLEVARACRRNFQTLGRLWDPHMDASLQRALDWYKGNFAYGSERDQAAVRAKFINDVKLKVNAVLDAIVYPEAVPSADGGEGKGEDVAMPDADAEDQEGKGAGFDTASNESAMALPDKDGWPRLSALIAEAWLAKHAWDFLQPTEIYPGMPAIEGGREGFPAPRWALDWQDDRHRGVEL